MLDIREQIRNRYKPANLNEGVGQTKDNPFLGVLNISGAIENMGLALDGMPPKNKMINDISKASKEGNFLSPYIHTPEYGTPLDVINSIPNSQRPASWKNIPKDVEERLSKKKVVTPYPRSREADPVTKQVLSTLLAPAQTFTTGLNEGAEAVKGGIKSIGKGDIGKGLLDVATGTVDALISGATPFNPILAGFSIANKLGVDVGGEEIMTKIMSPFSSVFADPVTQEIFRLRKEGKNDKEISKTLGLAPTQIKEKESSVRNSLAKASDLIYNLALFGKGEKLRRKISEVKTSKGTLYKDSKGKFAKKEEFIKQEAEETPKEQVKTETKEVSSKLPPRDYKNLKELLAEEKSQEITRFVESKLSKEEYKKLGEEIDKDFIEKGTDPEARLRLEAEKIVESIETPKIETTAEKVNQKAIDKIIPQFEKQIDKAEKYLKEQEKDVGRGTNSYKNMEAELGKLKTELEQLKRGEIPERVSKQFPDLESKPKIDLEKPTGNATVDKLRKEAIDEYNKNKIQPSGFNPLDYKAQIKYGAYVLKDGAVKFADWSGRMVKELGEKIKPQLLRIWNEIKKFGADLGKIAVDKIGEFVESKYNPARPLNITQGRLTELQNKYGIKDAKKSTVIPENKFAEGLKEISKTDKETLYALNEKISTEKTLWTKTKEKLAEETASIKKVTKTVIEPITTSIEKVNKDLFRKFRKFSFNYQLKTLAAHKVMGDYFETKAKVKMPDNVARKFDLALKNGWMDDAHSIAKKYGFDEKLNKVIELKDKLAEELDTKMIKDHFPRMVQDFNGFVKFLEQKYPDYYKDNFSRMIAEKSQKIGRALTTEEKATLINNALRGYNPGIALSDLGNMRKRIIQTLDGEMNQFYAHSDRAILQYVNEMVQLSEARKFFGKKGFDVNESVGQFIQDLREGKKIDIEGSKELTEVFKSYFNQKPITAKGLQNIRNIGVITKLANPFGTLTQLKDLAFSLYQSPTGTIKSVAEIISGKIKGERPTWTIEEMGVDPLKIAEELSNPSVRSKMVQKFLDISGFSKMDMIGKETLINTVWRKATKESRKLKLSPEFERRINRFFGEGEEKAAVLKDLREGKKTDRTAFLLFNEVMGTQPISLAELPRGYLKGGNWRVAYFLKTFTIRQLDFFLNETIRVMTDKSLPKEQRIQGGKNLMKLTTMVALTGISVDTIKSWLLGRDANVLEEGIDNLMSIALLSKYDYTKARGSGLAEALGAKILPPLDFISDPILYDLPNLMGEKGKALRTTKQIPIIGRFIYEAIKDKKSDRNTNRR